VSHRSSLILGYLTRWEAVLVLMLVVEIAIFGLINPRFLNLESLLDSTSDFAQIGIVALPLTLVIIAGGIDVSFSSSIGLSAIVFGVATFFGVPEWLGIVLALIVGAACGAFNAAIIYIAQIQPLVVSLGSLYLFLGLATVLSGLVGGSGYEGIGGFSDAFTNFANDSLLGLPVPLSIMLIEAIVLGGLLHFTRFGRMVFLIGLSESAAAYSGLPINWVKTWTYVLTGLGAAIAGLVLTSYFGSARTDLGTSTLLTAITAVALGGVSVYGGRGTIFGTLIATLLIGYLQHGLQMSGVSSQTSEALPGALLVIVVCVKQLGGGIGGLLFLMTGAEGNQKKGRVSV
jgi:AI-2 transport system permease protein